MSRLGFPVTTPLATLPRLRPCPLILVLDKIIAKELKDTKLLAKLSSVDMIAIGAQYHLRSLGAFYGGGRSRKRRLNEAQHYLYINAEALAFAEFVSYIKVVSLVVVIWIDFNLAAETKRLGGLKPI